MMTRLLQLVWMLALREGHGAARSCAPTGCIQTIDGMLYVGIRPATHRAA